MTEHTLTLEVQDEPRRFRCVCSCGRYASPWGHTNAVMGGGRRHVAQLRRAAAARLAQQMAAGQ